MERLLAIAVVVASLWAMPAFAGDATDTTDQAEHTSKQAVGTLKNTREGVKEFKGLLGDLFGDDDVKPTPVPEGGE